jgi:hypothetical protein
MQITCRLNHLGWGFGSAQQSLARIGPTHRSNLERSIKRALCWQFMYLPTAAWRCGRLKWGERQLKYSRAWARDPRARAHPDRDSGPPAYRTEHDYLTACTHRGSRYSRPLTRDEPR